jgi:hypothetical protein
MMIKQREQLATKVLDSIPQNIKPIDYLMEKLNISRESAYRRMRGDISFTFEEVTNLSMDLGFSVDEIIGMSQEKRIFFDLSTSSLSKPEENFLTMFREYSNYVESVTKGKNIEIFSAINKISLFLLAEYNSLFKLFYYKWIHQTYNYSINKPFSEIVIPPEIMDLRKKFQLNVDNISNLNYIIDRDIFLSIVREIQYYRNRNLITDEETLLLKQDLLQLLKRMELLMQKGTNEKGRIWNFYLSLLDIETNSVCSSSDHDMASLYWVYSVNAVVIRNREICTMHKKWLESLKKYSALVTLSNEILQAEFICKQRECIETINDDLSFYT